MYGCDSMVLSRSYGVRGSRCTQRQGCAKPTNVACSLGGITLGPEQGELDADFTALGGGDALLHKSGH